MGKERHHRRRPLAGRHLLTFGALGLLGVSGYELWIRLEDFWAWTKGVRHLSATRGTPFLEDMKIIFEEPEMRQLGFKLLFLAITILFAFICVIRRNRARGGWLLMALDAAVIGAGAWMGIYGFHPSDWAQTLKLVPLVLIPVGCVMNYAHRAILRKRIREREEQRKKKRKAEGSTV